MKIREYRRSDARAFIALVRALAAYEKLKPPSPAAARRLVREVGRRIKVLLAEVDGTAVAYAIYLFTYSSFLAKPTLYLEDIFILPEYRRSGIGSKMFDRLRADARRNGCGRMEWIVLGWNKPAIRFYDSLGARGLEDWIFYRLAL